MIIIKFNISFSFKTSVIGNYDNKLQNCKQKLSCQINLIISCRYIKINLFDRVIFAYKLLVFEKKIIINYKFFCYIIIWCQRLI